LAAKQKSALGEVLKTSFPAVIDLSSQTITWLIEAIFIGHLSAAALGGVGIALQIILLTFTVVLTFVMGASIIILRYLGQEDTWNANHVFAQALVIGAAFSVIIFLLWYFGGANMMAVIREDEPIARIYGEQYIKTVALFSFFIVVNFIAVGIIRMAGDTLITMKINLFINSLHIFLSFVLIFGMWGFPRLEARGAALAAGIAHTLGSFLTLYYLRSRKTELFFSFREFTRVNFDTVKRLFRLGLPTTVEQLVWAVGQLILSFYAARLGIVALAAHQVFLRIQSVLTMTFTGFGLASMTLVGKNLGADDEHRAVHTGRLAGRVALITAAVISVLLIAFRSTWMGIFTNNQEVIQFGAKAMIVMALIQIPKAVNIVFTGNLRGSADLTWLMWLAIGSVIFYETFLAYIFTFVLGFSLYGLWLVMGLDESWRLYWNYHRFRKRKWKRNTEIH